MKFRIFLLLDSYYAQRMTGQDVNDLDMGIYFVLVNITGHYLYVVLLLYCNKGPQLTFLATSDDLVSIYVAE